MLFSRARAPSILEPSTRRPGPVRLNMYSWISLPLLRAANTLTLLRNNPKFWANCSSTLFFNNAPAGGEPGGLSSELDFRNLNRASTAAIDVNGLLGGPGEPAAVSANFVAMSATIGAHELGHQMGLLHIDSFGPIGF